MIDADVNAISIDGSETLLPSDEKAQLIESFKAVTSFLAGDTKEIDPKIFTKYSLIAFIVASNIKFFHRDTRSFQPPVRHVSLFNREVTDWGEDIEAASGKGEGTGPASKTIEVAVEYKV